MALGVNLKTVKLTILGYHLEDINNRFCLTIQIVNIFLILSSSFNYHQQIAVIYQ